MALTWAIQVCRRCGRLAQWPGCEHWETVRPHDPNWAITISVRPTAGSAARLQKALAEARTEETR